jgi:hypothetical protein
LIGAVDRDVQPFETLERLDVHPEGARHRRRPRGGCDAPDGEAAFGEGGNEEFDGRTGAQAYGHAVLHQLRRGAGYRELLTLLIGHDH